MFGDWVLPIPFGVCPLHYCSQSRQRVRTLEFRDLSLTCLVSDGVVLVEKSNQEKEWH